jgi:uncharacterized membrane protein
MNKKTVMNSTLAGIIALTVSSTTVAKAEEHETEKCYGIVKAGENECASPSNGHNCHGNAKKDSDLNEWITVPKGTCEKIVGGSLKPGGMKDSKDNHEKSDKHK